MSEWRRFERASNDGGGRFWAIRVHGRECEIRFGAVGGADAAEERLHHASEAEAARVAKQKIRTKQRAGWVEVAVAIAINQDDAHTRALAQGQQLEAAIATEPGNLDHWAVYADWLQATEPLLGERVALGLALARVASKSARAQLETRIEELERTHGRELFGVTLASVLHADKLLSRPGNRAKGADVIELERMLGMILGARLRDPEDGVVKFDALVSALLDSPLARVLLDLRLETGPRSCAHTAELFVAKQHPHLRRLFLGLRPGSDPNVELTLPSIAAVLDSAPSLERLELRGNFHGEVTSELLRELKVSRPATALALPLPRWRLPALQTLHVIAPGVVDWRTVELPQLRRLLIEWQDCGDRLVACLARAPLLDQLDSLTLTQTRLTAEGIHTLLDNRERFGRIKQIELLDVTTEDALILRMHRRLPNVFARTTENTIDWSWREREAFTRF